MLRTATMAFLTLALPAASLLAQDKPAEKVTFNDHVLPIFRARCGSCHNGNDKKGGLVVDNYQALMTGGSSGTVVEGGDAGSSYLWSLINHESEPKMPPNAAKLPDNELATIKKWIDGGILETSGSTATIKKTMSVAKIEVTGQRPAVVAMPQRYLGDPQVQSPTVNAVTALACSPWASLGAVSGHKQVTLFNTQTAEVLGVLPYPEGQPHILKFSRTGDLLLVGGGRGGAAGKVVVYDVKTGERKIEVGDEYDAVLGADISPNQQLIALGGPKKILRVYSTATGELLFEQKKHTDWVTAIEFSPDGVLLASGDRANGLLVWESDTGKEFYNLVGHQGSVNDVSWRPDSNALASASEDNTIRLWEMNNGTEIKKWNAHGGCAAVDYTRDGRLVSTGRDRVVRLWNGDGGQLKEFGGMTDLGLEVAYDNETNFVLGGDWSGMVRIWNTADGALLHQINTNPPTLDSQIAAVTQAMNAANGQAEQQAAQLAGLQKVLTDRKTVADQATAQMNAANEATKKATDGKTAAEKALAEKTVALQQAEAALKQAEQTLAAAKAAYEKAMTDQQTVAVAKDGVAKMTADATTVTQQAQAAEKLAQENAAKAKAAADKAVAEAPAKPEETKAMQDITAALQTTQQKAAAVKAQLERLNAAKAQVGAQASAQK
ncbi:c-type cytochrome domain-containing protein [Planctomyces sp. SH-PL14]|uniref:WD40 domain-containing protein n=1 Tax=Planctomyces sp. SH-PL14 TaxID=1632864 RepID=UPI00078C3730|nr:c-type cytochrome domain-containing protein [Planctomyces sp. SH-PL14]AMV19305.1 WD domain, G-beta repeat [Planctomyces sp. SH-PL14]